MTAKRVASLVLKCCRSFSRGQYTYFTGVDVVAVVCRTRNSPPRIPPTCEEPSLHGRSVAGDPRRRRRDPMRVHPVADRDRVARSERLDDDVALGELAPPFEDYQHAVMLAALAS